jgi:hypothetical protein
MAKANATKLPPRAIVLLVILAAVSVVFVIKNLGRGGIGSREIKSTDLTYTPRPLPELEVGVEGWGPSVGGGDSFERNPFTFGAPPTPTRNLTPSPTRVPPPPRTPRPTPTPQTARGIDGEVLPPPPPFNRTYIGFFGPRRLQVAAFRDKDNRIEVAVVGDVLDDVYIVREIGLESVTIGFVGYAEEEDTRVPLAEN